MPEPFAIEISPGAEVTGLHYSSESALPGGPLLILAHGAGADQRHAFMTGTAQRLAQRGVAVVTFDFLYTARQRRMPDRPDVLEETWRAVLARVRARAGDAPIFAGGKSMGGRIASQVASDPSIGRTLCGLVFLGYPLHPPGKPAQLRSKHLPHVTAPMLFVQGAKDPFGTEEEMRPLVQSLPGADLFVVALGDHSFHVPKKAGVTGSQVSASVEDEIARWIARTERRQGSPA